MAFQLLPPLDTALARYLAMRAEPDELEELIHTAETRQVPGTAQRQANAGG